MSDLAEKFEKQTAQPGRARATLSQLRLMSGELTESGEFIVRVGLFGDRQTWKKVPGSGSGASQLFELEREG